MELQSGGKFMTRIYTDFHGFLIFIMLVSIVTFFTACKPSYTQENKNETQVTSPVLQIKEMQGMIVLVKDAKIYVDRGKVHGVALGTAMKVYELEAIKDMEGNLLEVEENFVGTLLIVEVRKLLSVGVMETSTKDFQRGFRVKFQPTAPEEKETEKGKPQEGHCPEEMLFYPSGEFSYLQTGDKENPNKTKEQLESVEAYCIDTSPTDQGRVLWEEALEYCESEGKRLCMKVELKKACTAKKAADQCADIEDDEAKKKCEAEAKIVNDFDHSYEWGFEWQEAGNTMKMGPGSCACGGTHPFCMGCYYPY